MATWIVRFLKPSDLENTELGFRDKIAHVRYRNRTMAIANSCLFTGLGCGLLAYSIYNGLDNTRVVAYIGSGSLAVALGCLSNWAKISFCPERSWILDKCVEIL